MAFSTLLSISPPFTLSRKNHLLTPIATRVLSSSVSPQNSIPRSQSSSLYYRNFTTRRSSSSSSLDGFLGEEEEESEIIQLSSTGLNPLKFAICVVFWASFSLLWFARSGDAKAAADSIKSSTFGLRIASALRRFGWPDEAVVFALTTLPVIELRGAIPVGYWMQLKPILLTFFSVLGVSANIKLYSSVLFVVYAEKENLCLYGLPNETWEVNLPVEEVPPELPEPALGINFARDGMQEKDWVSLVAVHSDSWLLSVAFYFGARFGFGKNERKKLFQMINELPTIFEIVTGNAKQSKDLSGNNNNNSNKSKSNGLKVPKMSSPLPKEEDESEDEEEDDEQGAVCGACGDSDGTDEFWICCDACEKWFHGKCVKITPAKAEHIKHYKCPSCSNKRARP
ncbi:hypothetical protein N665_1692s0008 [Sinapis alba]|nr:hypothetical protein N665_1692s0008 [Sinapis alba]